MKLTGRWFPQIVDRDTGNLLSNIYITKIVVSKYSEPVRGRSRGPSMHLFLHCCTYAAL